MFLQTPISVNTRYYDFMRGPGVQAQVERNKRNWVKQTQVYLPSWGCIHSGQCVCLHVCVCRGQGLIVSSLWMRKLKFKNLDASSMVLQLLWSVVVKFMDSAARLQRFEPALCWPWHVLDLSVLPSNVDTNGCYFSGLLWGLHEPIHKMDQG